MVDAASGCCASELNAVASDRRGVVHGPDPCNQETMCAPVRAPLNMDVTPGEFPSPARAFDSADALIILGFQQSEFPSRACDAFQCRQAFLPSRGTSLHRSHDRPDHRSRKGIPTGALPCPAAFQAGIEELRGAVERRDHSPPGSHCPKSTQIERGGVFLQPRRLRQVFHEYKSGYASAT